MWFFFNILGLQHFYIDIWLNHWDLQHYHQFLNWYYDSLKQIEIAILSSRVQEHWKITSQFWSKELVFLKQCLLENKKRQNRKKKFFLNCLFQIPLFFLRITLKNEKQGKVAGVVLILKRWKRNQITKKVKNRARWLVLLKS